MFYFLCATALKICLCIGHPINLFNRAIIYWSMWHSAKNSPITDSDRAESIRVRSTALVWLVP